jgi:cation transport regulator
MPYASNAELPPAVRSSLPEDGQTHWREAFNHALVEYKNEQTAFKVAWAAVRKGADCRSFEGWLNVGLVDLQKEKTDQKALNEALKQFVSRGGPIHAEHSNHQYAAVYDVELKEYKPGILGNYGYGVVFKGDSFYDNCWEAMKNGKLPEFSIGGFKHPMTVKCDNQGCFYDMKMRIVTEVSGVPKGACPQAKATVINQVAKACPGDGKEVKMTEETKTEEKPAAKEADEVKKEAEAVRKGPARFASLPEDELRRRISALDEQARAQGQMTNEQHFEHEDLNDALIMVLNARKCEAKKQDAAPTEEAKPKGDILEDKINQLFALVTGLKSQVEAFLLKVSEPPAKPPEPPAEAPKEQPSGPPEQEPAADAPPAEKPKGEKVAEKADDVQKSEVKLKEAVEKAAVIKAEELVRKQAVQEALAKGTITPRPAPDDLSVSKSQNEEVQRQFEFGSKELMAVNYEDTLRMRSKK